MNLNILVGRHVQYKPVCLRRGCVSSCGAPDGGFDMKAGSPPLLKHTLAHLTVNPGVLMLGGGQ